MKNGIRYSSVDGSGEMSVGTKMELLAAIATLSMLLGFVESDLEALLDAAESSGEDMHSIAEWMEETLGHQSESLNARASAKFDMCRDRLLDEVRNWYFPNGSTKDEAVDSQEDRG